MFTVTYNFRASLKESLQDILYKLTRKNNFHVYPGGKETRSYA